MSDGFSIEVKGLDKVRRSLYDYSRQLGDRVIIGALKEGAKVVQRAAKSGAPRKTGRLKRGIVVKKSKIHKATGGSSSLGVFLTLRTGKGKKDPKDAFYGRFVEDGWNVRGPSKQKGGASGGRGRKSAPGKRDIPGKKFIKGAFAAKRAEAIKTIVAAAEKASVIITKKMGLS